MDFQKMLAQQEEQAKSGAMYETKPQFKSDERFYTISKDQEGNGTVTVRFLPSFNKSKDNLNYFVKRYTHNVKNSKLYPGAEKPEQRSFWGDDAICPKTISSDNSCPICDHGWELYNEAKENGVPKEKLGTILGNWTNNEELITNILVINDPINKDNNGKVFLFKLSKTILDSMKNEAEKVKEICAQGNDAKLAQGIPSNVTYFDSYNLLTGKNITLKYKNYKKVKPAEVWGSSYWDVNFTSLVKNEEEWKAVMEKTYCLEEFTTDAKVQSEDFLNEKLDFLEFRDGKESKKESNQAQQQVQQEIPTFNQVQEQVQQEIQRQETPKEEPVKETPKETTPEVKSEDDFFAQFK